MTDEGLKMNVFTGIRWNGIYYFIVTIGGVAQLYILVRLLSPSDFGMMAIVNAVIAFSSIFLDAGMGSGIIYKQEYSNSTLSTLYLISIIVGVGLTAIILILSPILSWFYGIEGLFPLLNLVSMIFIFNGFGNLYQVLLRKELQFRILSLIHISSFFISISMTIFLAFAGYGVYSLVWGMLLSGIVNAILYIINGRKYFKPTNSFKWAEIKFYLEFGFFQLGERLFNVFNGQIDVLLIGKFLGADILGVYDVLKRFIMRPIQIINPVITSVMFPFMSKVQSKGIDLAHLYHKQLNAICLINFPIYVLLFVLADAVIIWMFGQEWLEYRSIFLILILYAMLYSTGNPVGTLLLSKGKANWGFYWNLLLTCIIPLGIYLSLTLGLQAMVLTLLSIQIVFIIPNYLFLVRPLIVGTARQYFYQIIEPLFLSIIMGFIVYFFVEFCSAIDGIYRLIIGIAIGGLSYLLILWKFKKSFLIDITNLINVRQAN